MVDITDLTRGENAGNGIFDELMRTVKAHLHEEHKKDRITGADYATVYLGSMQAVLAQATQFVLTQGINSRQEELLAEQTLKTQQETAVVLEQKLLLQKQITGQDTTNTNLVKQGSKLDEEILLLQEQVADLTKAGLLKDAQIAKLAADKALIEQKKLTEEAQVTDTLSDATAVAGALGKQKELLNAQKDGFIRAAEQKATKQLLDVWAIMRTTNEQYDLPSSISNTEINKVIAKLKAGIEVV